MSTCSVRKRLERSELSRWRAGRRGREPVARRAVPFEAAQMTSARGSEVVATFRWNTTSAYSLRVFPSASLNVVILYCQSQPRPSQLPTLLDLQVSVDQRRCQLVGRDIDQAAGFEAQLAE